MILITNYMPTKLFYRFLCVGRGSLLHLEFRSIIHWLENMDYVYNRRKNWPAKRERIEMVFKFQKQLITDSWMCANPNHIRQNVWKRIFFQDIIVTIKLLCLIFSDQVSMSQRYSIKTRNPCCKNKSNSNDDSMNCWANFKKSTPKRGKTQQTKTVANHELLRNFNVKVTL